MKLAVVALAFLAAAPVAAEDFSRAEVEAVFGQPVDTFSPAGDLGLPYRADVVAVSYVVADRTMAAALGARSRGELLTTVLFDGAGRLIEARQRRVGAEDGPTYDVTVSLRRLLRGRRT